MHKDVIRIAKENIIKPKNNIYIVYFSSISNNTHKFIEKLCFKNTRIPYNITDEIVVNEEFVLIVPTYAAGGEVRDGAVPKQVIKFLNNINNRKLCRGVIASGNTNFGNTFAIAGPIISKKLNVPLLYQFELLGTSEDVKTVKNILTNFWKEL